MLQMPNKTLRTIIFFSIIYVPYRKPAIITRGLYIFHSIFEDQESFLENSDLLSN